MSEVADILPTSQEDTGSARNGRADARSRLIRTLPWLSLVISLGLTAAGLFLLVLLQKYSLPAEYGIGPIDAVGQVVLLAFPIAGALITHRRSDNRIGWLFCITGILWSLYVFADAYTLYAMAAEPGSLPLGLLTASISSALSSINLFFTAIASFLLFPTGHLLSKRWLLVAWLAALGLVLIELAYVIEPGPMFDYPFIDNPTGIEGAKPLTSIATTVAAALLIITLSAAAISQVIRFRRAKGEQRLQLKWFALSAALFLASVFVDVGLTLAGVSSLLVGVVVAIPLMGIPISAGIAVLKYRLYEIDIIINRTIVYTVLTAILGLGYATSIVLLQQLFAPLTQGSDVAVTLSTIGVAVAFKPVQSRTQELVDRRFYRRKYDSITTVDSFTVRLREQIDIDTLNDELCGVIHQTIQPAHVSLWIRNQTKRDSSTMNRAHR